MPTLKPVCEVGMYPVEVIGSARGLDTVRRWTPLSWKKLVAGVLCSDSIGSLLRKIYSDRIPHRGHRIRTDSPLVSSATVAQIYFGIYERAEVDLVARFLPREYDVVEFGASLGVNSCNISSKLRAGCRLICVEADSILTKLAADTIALNGYADRVRMVNAAIDYSGACKTSLYKGNDTLSGNILRPKGTLCEQIEVDTITLRKILRDYAIGDYSLVVDIEGAEVGVLLNEAEALRRCHSIIIEIDTCSYGGKHYEYSHIRDMICALGFVERYAYGPCAAFLRKF